MRACCGREPACRPAGRPSPRSAVNTRLRRLTFLEVLFLKFFFLAQGFLMAVLFLLIHDVDLSQLNNQTNGKLYENHQKQDIPQITCLTCGRTYVRRRGLCGNLHQRLQQPNANGLHAQWRNAGRWRHPVLAIENGYLALTYAENSLQGSVVFDELDPGATMGGFTVTFNMRIGGGSSTPADGMAFFFGSDIDANANFGEEGPASTAGITVSFDTDDNGGGEAPAIDVMVNGVQVAHTRSLTFSTSFPTPSPMSSSN